MATTMTLGQLMTATRQRADMIPVGYTPSLTNTDYFVTDPELISYINQSYFELYDLLVGVYEDYYVAPPLIIPTNGSDQLYPLPDGVLYSAAPEFYKILGLDLGLNGSGNAWVTLQKFDFIQRNRYLYPQLTSTYLGVFNLRYRIVGSNLMLIPTPSGGQYLRMWYIPRMRTLAALTDTADGVSGWTEYIITDAAIKCGQKEETDVTALAMQKMALIKRIEEMGQNRDAGQPDTISNIRSQTERWGGGWGGDGPGAGYAIAPLGTMFPSLSIHDSLYDVLRYAVLNPKAALAYVSLCILFAYFGYLFLGKFSKTVTRTRPGNLVSRYLSTLATHIKVIVRPSANKKVGGSHTRGVVALMANDHSTGDGTVVYHPRYPASHVSGISVSPKKSITVIGAVAGPKPARLSFLNSVKKLLCVHEDDVTNPEVDASRSV